MYSCHGSSMLMKLIQLPNIFNIEKQNATSKQITYLKMADNSVTEDEQVIRQMTIDYYRNLFTAETVVYDNIDMFLTGLTSIDETERRHLE